MTVDARTCPNCHASNIPNVDECYSCGYDGYCFVCREPTQFTESADLNYCSDECVRGEAV